eukprot:TRINITY_DN31743_c0_g1_i1.p1 TRINITY_DN31743_c0_g1~~TRINITY_DN31743_c0_g1_i1.p1  ORF type:complete len:150 (-),score=46.93 TRINITY_DN31743_c0_g1_i1:198-647(-)
MILVCCFFFFKQKTAYEMQRGLVGSEMCIRDRYQRRVHGFLDNEPTFQMMCHFLMRGDETPGVNEKFGAVQLRFLEMFEKVVKTLSGGEEAVTQLHIRAFFASLAGIVMTFRHFPGYTDQERRAYLHKLALLIMSGGKGIGVSEPGKVV